MSLETDVSQKSGFREQAVYAVHVGRLTLSGEVFSAGVKPEGNRKSPFTVNRERSQCSAYADPAEAVAGPQEEPCRPTLGVCRLQVHEVSTIATCRTNGHRFNKCRLSSRLKDSAQLELRA